MESTINPILIRTVEKLLSTISLLMITAIMIIIVM